MELRAIRVGGGVVGRLFADNVSDVEQFSLRYGRDAEIYMGVAPRMHDGNGSLANCAMPTALWIDADDAAATRAELALFDLDPSMMVRSGRGLHVYWLLHDVPKDMSQVRAALRQLAVRLEGDVKSAEPAHILRVPGTMNHKYSPPRPVEVEYINDQRYKIEDFLPSASAAFLKGMAYMAELPPAVEGKHGDDATYRAACVLVRDLGLNAADALRLMLEWNARCSPPWTEGELMKKIRGAEAYGVSEKGVGDPAVDFEGLANSNGDVGPISESKIKWLTEKYKVVNDNGVLRIYTTVRDETLGRNQWQTSRRTDFLELCRSVYKLPKVQRGDKYVEMGKFWLDDWPGKNTFTGITMRPECSTERTPDGMLNMWRGFAFEPRPGSWALLKSLIFESFCQWDDKSYDYIMDWMARAVQRPWEPAGTALVFRGKKGTGKGTLGRAFYRLFGQHGMHFASRELLTGHFNAHLKDCVALFADEAFYAGDKQGESVLKAFITEPALMYEEKGKNPVMGRNCLHVIMASNLDWVVPAGIDNERRFAVFEVDDDHHNKWYWDALYDELNNGGMSAMLHELLRRDASGFDSLSVPQTAALAAQKAHAMDPMADWLLTKAENEWQDFGESGKKDMFLADDIYDSFLRHCDEMNVHKRQNSISFGISLRKYMPRDFPIRRRVMKEGRQKYYYVLSDAEECAKHIRKMLGNYDGGQEKGQSRQDGNF